MKQIGSVRDETAVSVEIDLVGRWLVGEGQEARTGLMAEINAELLKVQEFGVELKDPALGLIDFPSVREDKIVYLCWRLGETEIGYWHDTDTGYASRQPL